MLSVLSAWVCSHQSCHPISSILTPCLAGLAVTGFPQSGYSSQGAHPSRAPTPQSRAALSWECGPFPIRLNKGISPQRSFRKWKDFDAKRQASELPSSGDPRSRQEWHPQFRIVKHQHPRPGKAPSSCQPEVLPALIKSKQ